MAFPHFGYARVVSTYIKCTMITIKFDIIVGLFYLFQIWAPKKNPFRQVLGTMQVLNYNTRENCFKMTYLKVKML